MKINRVLIICLLYLGCSAWFLPGLYSGMMVS